MIKKILTTQPHWVIFILGFPYLFTASISNQMNLNRTIGWVSIIPEYYNVYYWLGVSWLVIMPICYWILLRFNFSLNTYFISTHLCFLLIFILTGFTIYGYLTNWALFLFILVTSIIGGRGKGSSKSIDIIDQEL